MDVYSIRYYEFLSRQTDLAAGTLIWQARASEISMWVVFAVVFAGVAFSGYQLFHATRIGSTGVARAAAQTSTAGEVAENSRC
jgi:hypothetical protein